MKARVRNSTSGNRAARGWLLLGLCLMALTASAEEVLLHDDFNESTLDSSTWGLATWNIGDKTQFGNQPVFWVEGDTSFITLPLDTYNPLSPGQLVFGTEIFSLENFPVGEGVEYLARARLRSHAPGLVAAFFTYNQKRQKGRWISDEIDFEVLSKQDSDRLLMTSWNDWGAPGSDYEDGVHHAGVFPAFPGYDWQEWNIYAMRWYTTHIEWWLNDVMVHTQASPVPDQPQPVRVSLWAGGSTWPDAFDAALAPVTSQAANRRFEWDVDYILVSTLADEPGGGSAPAAPSNLSASVDANKIVSLSWSDNSSNETAFTLHRAWKPKGNSSPDYQWSRVLGQNVTGTADSPADGDYLYRVTASNADGESAPSNEVTVKVGSTKGGGKPNRVQD